jgi:hypothetical protein
MLSICTILLFLENTSFSKESFTPIIAIGDLHADLESSKKAFQIAGILNEKGEWIQDNIIVVQTGDLTDRGPDGETLLKWIQHLEKEAPKHNSQFYTLIGNHEAMNIKGDWRYVSPADVTSFGGLEERKKSFSPGGFWSEWILSHEAVLDIQGNVFVHGGVSTGFAKDAKDLSYDVQSALRSRRNELVLQDNGPLWYRGYWQNTEELACSEATFVLNKMNATRMIMGHTTQRDGKVRTRCDGRLIAIDTGISKHYGENVAAIRIDEKGVTALYSEYTELIVPAESYVEAE